jgi:hypothetical protein
MTWVGHKKGLKTSEPRYLRTTHVAYSVYHLWPSLVSLDLSCRDLIYGINVIIIEASMYSQDLCFFTFLSLFHFLNYNERGEIKNKKITLKAHRCSDDGTTNIIKTSQQDESNDIKESHKQWTEWAT